MRNRPICYRNRRRRALLRSCKLRSHWAIGERSDGSEIEDELLQRLDRYVRIDTQSDASSSTSPSTAKQYELLNLPVAELAELGIEDVRLTDYGAVLATIPATVPTDAPTIALLAHVDTAPQFIGTGVGRSCTATGRAATSPCRTIRRWCSRRADLPYLATKLGEDIVTTSGTTLLGIATVLGASSRRTPSRSQTSNRTAPKQLPPTARRSPPQQVASCTQEVQCRSLTNGIQQTVICLSGCCRFICCFSVCELTLVRCSGIYRHSSYR